MGARSGTEWAHFKSSAYETASRWFEQIGVGVQRDLGGGVPSIRGSAETFTQELIAIEAHE